MLDALKQTTDMIPNLSGDASSKDKDLAKVCAEFESLLIHYILKTGRSTLPKNSLLGHSNESEIYKSMMDEKVAISVSRAGGMGIGKLLYEQLAQRNGDAPQVSDFI